MADHNHHDRASNTYNLCTATLMGDQSIPTCERLLQTDVYAPESVLSSCEFTPRRRIAVLKSCRSSQYVSRRHGMYDLKQQDL
jgi:hypothetical protein